MEMARLERRAPVLAATADIVTVADIGSDSCPDGSVAGRSEGRFRGGQIGQVPADPDQIRDFESQAWPARQLVSAVADRCVTFPFCQQTNIRARELALLRRTARVANHGPIHREMRE